MSKKYELWFSRSDKDYKVMEFTSYDSSFEHYILDTVMSNLQYDINDLNFELDEPIDDFKLLEVKNEENWFWVII